MSKQVACVFYQYGNDHGNWETLVGVFSKRAKADDAIVDIVEKHLEEDRRDGNGARIDYGHFETRLIVLDEVLVSQFGEKPYDR